MANLIGIPLIILLATLQMVVVSRLPLLHGTADLILLVLAAWSLQEKVISAWWWAIFAGVLISLISALPFFIPLAAYLFVTGMARLLRRRIWQTPILAMFVVTLLGTLVYHLLSLVGLQFQGRSLVWSDSLNQVTLPSMLLNLILALPVYAIVEDLAEWLYPGDLEI